MSTPVPGRVNTPEGYGLSGPADGTALAWSTVVEWLTSSRNYWVCTTRVDGRPHAMPVWGLWMDDACWFSTDPTSLKARNLTARPDAVVHLESGDEVAVLEGKAVPLKGDALPDGFAAAYAAKYDIELDLSNPDFAFFVVHPRVALTWTEADFPNTATRWTFSA